MAKIINEESNGNKMEKIKIIGITGLYCAGKNHIAKILEKRSLPVLDIDKLGHEVIEREKERIKARFGEEILKDGKVDRKRLGDKVFGKPAELAALEEIIHPIVNQDTLSWLNSRRGNACAINAALLHRSSAFENLDLIILVEAPFFTRLLRAKKRDCLSWSALFKRFRSQEKFGSQYFKGKTDIYRVGNKGFSGFRSNYQKTRLENLIDKILSQKGIL